MREAWTGVAEAVGRRRSRRHVSPGSGRAAVVAELLWLGHLEIKLEYEGTLFTEWSVPEICFVLNKSSPRTELRCSSPGVHAIKPIVTGPDEEERNLFVDSSHTCFLWYYRVRHFFNNLTQVISVWVYDPENADPDELLGSAEEPSINSIVLSTQMATLGQKPIVHTILKRKTYVSNEKMKKGTWHIMVPMTRDDALKEIRGNQVTFQDCFIADFLIVLTFPSLTIPEIPGSLPISSPRGSQLMVSWDACVVASVVLVTDMETFQTNDSFRTWTRIRVPPGSLSDAERRSVADVIVSRDGVFFLTNGVLYQKSFRGFLKLGRILNLPNGGIIGISSRKWCWVKYLSKAKERRSNFAVWTENEVYLEYILLKFTRLVTTTELKNILNLSVTATLTIHSVEYTGHPLEIAVFLSYCTICTVTKKIFLVIYNEDTKQWVSQEFTLDAPIDSVFVPYFIFSALPGLILWNKHSIYYCYHNFTFTGILQTPAGHGNLSMLSNDSIIHEVFIDYYGNILIKMENNVIFHSKINTRDVVKLHLWTNNTTRAFVLLSTSGYTYFLYALDNGTIQIQDYPLSLETRSVAFTTKDKCPYMAFHNNVARVFYFLDKGEILTLWTQIIYPENTGLYVVVESYGPKILEESHDISFEAAFGHCTKTLAYLLCLSLISLSFSLSLSFILSLYLSLSLIYALSLLSSPTLAVGGAGQWHRTCPRACAAICLSCFFLVFLFTFSLPLLHLVFLGLGGILVATAQAPGCCWPRGLADACHKLYESCSFASSALLLAPVLVLFFHAEPGWREGPTSCLPGCAVWSPGPGTLTLSCLALTCRHPSPVSSEGGGMYLSSAEGFGLGSW
ncbi:cation channel sperm-associated auxiliary subunit epsilon isoform X6 [Macaca nemestrina]|uniref:cation channel sperm-associated auxiliary subunit epsilon isoform X6 n=1 Tax=Macaca nemestrina TaxID=9545 RepID=UPI0039B9B00F